MKYLKSLKSDYLPLCMYDKARCEKIAQSAYMSVNTVLTSHDKDCTSKSDCMSSRTLKQVLPLCEKRILI